MKAIQVHTFGGPEVLTYQDVPRPTAGVGEVLIRVQAAGVNPAEWKAVSGLTRRVREVPLPFIPGWDVSGIIEEVGPDVTAFQQGDAVYGLLRFPSPSAGTYAEYTTGPVADLALKPTSIDHIQAAAVPMAALTAWQGLFVHGRMEAGQTVLITGAAGGVGHFAVQLAKSKGARVIGVASGRHAAFLHELGVDQFIDYTSTSPEGAVHDVDLVVDTAGGMNGDPLLSVLKPGGTLIPISANQFSPERVAQAGVSIVTTIGPVMQVRSSGAQLVEIGKLIDAGQVRVAIDTVVPLAEAARAHERSAAGHVRGKIVLAI
ncbi:NADPH:quinone reductase [Reticulibacter mediterranei]|uniref:NADPH:quinone reductase n=1 Tax=Reticulibacter mediterranei TaxID=2778369 RepID=A0A8J3ILJ7_9CHLR|nr:NADP-dependent oxidoreductase [Reticulibacter mediterranei]GHO97844.1 NADPH:quinone reductase [Reticulibacter mediterranei]